MSANRLFLVCSAHQSLDQALVLGERSSSETQYTANNLKRADEWFAKHIGCGGGCDHFQLAYHRPQDWDQSPPAPAVASAVRVALAEQQLADSAAQARNGETEH